MANLSKQQVADIVSKAPQGTSPAGIISALRQQGHILEGYPITETASITNVQPDKQPLQSALQPAISDIIAGAEKGATQSTLGIAKLGNFIANQTIGRVINAVQGRGFVAGGENQPNLSSNPQVQAQLKPVGLNEKIGKTAEQIGEFAVPGSKVAEATKALSFIPRVAARALTSGGVAAAQSGQVGTEAGIAAGTEAVLPIAGKLLSPTFRFLKSIASGVSGAGATALETVVKNPETASEAIKTLEKSGQGEIVKKNAETIINGVSKVRQEARQAYGKAVSELKSTDINPTTFRQNVSQTLDSIGSEVKNGVRRFTSAEFDNPSLVKKANTLINKLSTVELNGLSLNRLQNEIDAAAFKTTGGDPQRLAFNAFLHDLSGGIRNSINGATTKLGTINKAFSQDMQLAEAVQNIFGNVKYKNLTEIAKVSRRLDELFSKGGYDQEIVDKFLTRIGVKPVDFRATEAVRNISKIENKANTPGAKTGELIRGITSSIVTPEMVRDAAIYTGIAEKQLLPILQAVQPAARGALLKALSSVTNQ